jgi:hypothetical protein
LVEPCTDVFDKCVYLVAAPHGGGVAVVPPFGCPGGSVVLGEGLQAKYG